MSADVRTALWRDLCAAAKAWAANPKTEEGQFLSDAAKAWGAAHAPSAKPASGAVFPNYGRSKGASVAGASKQDLEFYASGCRRTLDDPSKERWHEKERQLLAAIEAELAR